MSDFVNDLIDDDSELFLEHYGVKGMQWGVRRSASQLKSAAKERIKSSKDAKAATKRTRFTKGDSDAPKNLSDKELKDRISRMDTEKRYNELNAKTVSHGQKNVNEVLTNVGKKTAQTALSGAAIYVVGKAVERKFGAEVATPVKKGGFNKK